MKSPLRTLLQWQFEYRIFISLSVALGIALLAFTVWRGEAGLLALLFTARGVPDPVALRLACLASATTIALASLLRMWAGSVLHSHRVMSFKVQARRLITAPPYTLVRNPIYLADALAVTAFALTLPPVVFALPVLLLVHYHRLIRTEEESLQREHGKTFQEYTHSAPRFWPTPSSIRRTIGAGGFCITRDGVRHNALYVLFVPGFLIAAWTTETLHAVLVGLPLLLDWAVIHTRIGLHPHVEEEPPPALSPPGAKGVFGEVLYAQCWEDPELDREAFRIGPEDVVFTITSGGCNALTFLADAPREVIALDLNPHQNFLLELKIAAFRVLDYPGVLEFLGAAPSEERLTTYARLRDQLSLESRRYWDDHPRAVERGLIHCGRYERYMRALGRLSRALVGRDTLREMLAARSEADRRDLFDRRWNTLRWRLFTRLALSRTTMTLLFDKAFFAQLESSFSFGGRFAGRIRKALITLPLERSPFFNYIIEGNYSRSECLPRYLRPELYEPIRKNLERLSWVTMSCEEFLARRQEASISRFNFTNIFEWVTPASFTALLRETLRVATPGAVMTYRNLLVPRSRPEELARWIEPRSAQAHSLHLRDLSFIYQSYNVEILKPREAACATECAQMAEA
jgi:S-adenosylmethionine-diacylglycerol 3-amino-3-carboxypropyl transferase